MDTTIKKCADKARELGYEIFSVQFYGECWSGNEAATSYDKFGMSTNCWKGVGKDWTNMVYKLNNAI